MKILYIREPVWNPDKREWVINYGVSDYIDDRPVKYVQKVTTETLISAVNYIKLLEQQREKTNVIKQSISQHKSNQSFAYR